MEKAAVSILHASDDELKLNHTERITRLEGTVKGHSETLQVLAPTVASIDSNLKAIKWCAVGATVVFVVQKVGLIAVLSKVFGLT